MNTELNHLKWSFDGIMSCEHCNDSYQINMPIPLYLIEAIQKAYIEAHKKCRKKKE